jgi:hypothetical protein
VSPDEDQETVGKSPYSLDIENPDSGGPPPNTIIVGQRLRDAAAKLLRGDVAGIDKLVFRLGDQEPAPLREVSHLRQDHVRRAFVKPERWRDTLAAASGRQLVVLRAEPGPGRVAAAIRLLQTTGTGPIYALEPDTDLSRFAAWLEADGPGGGFVLDDPVGELTGLDEIAAALDKRDARLVIGSDREVAGHTVTLGALPGAPAEPDDVGDWFAALPDVRARSLAIALAALDGLSYESVLRAATRLSDAIDGPPQVVAPAATLQPPWHDPFDGVRPDRLVMLRARTRTVTVQGTYGRRPTEIIEYEQEGRAGAVLDHVWHSYDLHRPLLAWLAELAHDAEADVRIWAGTTLGLFATYAYDMVFATVLQRMTTSESRATRDVVAYALRVPAAESRLMPLVRRVSNRLHGNPGNPLGQACGARVRAIGFGPLGLDPVLDKLDRLAILDDHRIATAIGDSMGDLMAQDMEVNAPIILRHLAGWFDDRWRNRTAQWVFHELANSLRTDIDHPHLDSARPSYVTWPTLLMLADQRPELRPLMISMWGRLFNTGEFGGRVADAMDNWASWAESYDDVRTAFVRLLSAAAALSPRTRTLILRHCARWQHVEELFPLPLTARAVENALNARNDAP